jgi:hypothetical protein
MNDEDELQKLWKSQSPCGSVKGNEMLEIVQKKMQKFDRMIAWRNRVECIAAAAVVIFFTWTAVYAPNIVMKAGSLVVAGGAAWIIYYMIRYGNAKVTVDASENLANYTQALVGRYDHQIRLLKSVKYWYLLPMYIGLLILSVGISMQRAQQGAPAWVDVIGPAICTAVFGVIWWLNEGPVVRRLQSQRAQLLSITNQYEVSTEEK